MRYRYRHILYYIDLIELKIIVDKKGYVPDNSHINSNFLSLSISNRVIHYYRLSIIFNDNIRHIAFRNSPYY